MAAQETAHNKSDGKNAHFHEGLIGRSLEGLLRRTSSVGDQPIFATDQFPWARELETNASVINSELRGVMSDIDSIPSLQDVTPRNYSITQDDRWKSYFFSFYGYKVEKNCRACPETTRLIENIPGVLAAFFSILGPRKHIPPHRGRYNGILRYHLGLIIPQSAAKCRIRVGGDESYWTEGRSLIFDDTYEHEVWNDTDDWRVVLFVDFLRPLPFPMSLVNKAVVAVISRRESVTQTHQILRETS